MHKTVKIIRTEHRRLAAMINCFIGVIGDIETGRIEANFDFLETVHSYFRSFLYKFHHPKEDEYLFPMLLKASSDLGDVIHKLEDDHKVGFSLLEKLDACLLAFKNAEPDALLAYCKVAENYRDFEWQHMGTEEKEILPMAEKILKQSDWDYLDQIFEDHDDPVFGDKPQAKYQNLLSEIVNAAPAPHGLAGD